MRHGLFFVLVSAMFCSPTVQRCLHAQPAPRNTAPATDAAAAKTPTKQINDSARQFKDGIKEEQGILYVTDPKTGKLVPVLIGVTPEEMKRWNDAQHSRAKLEDPPFSVEKIALTGAVRRVEDGRQLARLQGKISLRVLEEDVGVPLELSGWALDDFKPSGEGNYFLARDEKSGGYVCRIRATKDSDHVLEFSLVRQVRVIGGEWQLQLEVPSAATSTLTLSTPLRAEGKATGGTLEKTTHSVGNPPTTTFSVVGLKRGFVLAWHEAGKPIAKVQQVIKVEGEMVATIDELSVRHVTKLTLQSVSGAMFQAIRVRLPQGATLESTQPFEAKPIGGNGSGIYEIALQKPTQGPVAVTLTTTQIRKVGQPVELGGFEVLPTAGMSISRQGGIVVVHVVGDWNVTWPEKIKNVRRVNPPNVDPPTKDDPPKEPADGDPVAAFAYATQPFSLAASVRAKRKVLRVEPYYLFDVGSEEIRLLAVMKYHVRGPKIFDVSIDMPGWEILTAKFAGLDAKAINVGDDGRVVVDLPEGQTGAFELTLSARQDVDPQAQSVRWNLPKPRVDSLDPAAVTVIAADDVILKINVEDGGLLRPGLPVPLPAPLTLPRRQQPPKFYRVDPAAGGFQAEMLIHDQQIDTEVETDVTLQDDGRWRVSQKLIYHVQYKSVGSVTLDMPHALIASKPWENESNPWKIDGVVLQPQAFLVQDRDPGSPLVPVLVQLPIAQIGRFELICGFPLDGAEPFTTESAELAVPLLMPSGLTPQRNELRLVAGGEVQVQEDSVAAPWNLATEPNGETEPGRSPTLTSEIATHEAVFSVRRVASTTPGTTNIERVWIQTWFTGSARRDRVVFRFTSRGGSLRVSLPEGVIRDKVQATLGIVEENKLTSLAATRIGRTSDKKLSVELLPVTSSNRQYVLELVYRFADRGPGNGSRPGALRVAVPQLDGQIWVRHLYWQLVLPENEHVVVEPSGLTPEYRWGWQRMFWGRQPLRRQADLELWSGAAPRDPLPEATSQYLFSAVGPHQQLMVQTADRSWIVGASSLLVLAAGLLLIYLPAVRRSGVLLLVAIMLVALSWWVPSTTILLAQAASVGLVLALTALMLVRSIARFPSAGAVSVGRSSSIIEISTTQLRPAPVNSSTDLARASTATALTAAQPPPDDSKQ